MDSKSFLGRERWLTTELSLYRHAKKQTTCTSKNMDLRMRRNIHGFIVYLHHEEAPFHACLAEMSNGLRPLIRISFNQQREINGGDLWGIRMDILVLREGVVGGDGGELAGLCHLFDTSHDLT